MSADDALTTAPRHILVINVSRIGDTLLVTPVLRALAQIWPHARLHFFGHPKRVEVIQHLPYVATTGAITKNRARWRGWLPGRTFDIALVLGYDRSLVRYALRTAQRVAAFRQGDSSLDTRLFRCVEPPARQTMHAARIPLLLTRALGVPEAGLRLAYHVTAQEQAWARSTLAAGKLGSARPMIGFQVASFPTKAFRDWPLQRFAELAGRILSRWPDAQFLLFGGSLDTSRTRRLAQQLTGRATPFAGKVTLRQSAALMNELDLYVGVDTGPTHIAGALDVPMVALYHCQSPSTLLMPLERPGCHVVDHPRAQGACGPDTPMDEISVEAVWAKVMDAMVAQ